LYAGALGPQRGVATQARQLEINNLDELLSRLRASSERLKTQEQRRKDFESASKKYYDEISKVSRHPLDFAPPGLC
jgi:flagellar motility protein MotE (MotC chaperone)